MSYNNLQKMGALLHGTGVLTLLEVAMLVPPNIRQSSLPDENLIFYVSG